MTSRRRSLIALVVIPVVLLISAVSIGVANARQANPARTPAVATITIHSFAYKVPKSVTHGVTVKVVNQDSVAHTVTSNKAGKFNVRVPAHSSRTFRAPVKGTYGFYCTIHRSMKGTLHVK